MSSAGAHNLQLMSRLKSSFLDDIAYKKVLDHFSKIKHGCLYIYFEGDVLVLGKKTNAAGLSAHIYVHNKAVFRQFVVSGSVGVAEMYMLGAWSCPDLVALVQLMCRNIDVLNKIDQRRYWWSHLSRKLWNYFRKNTPSGSEKNISSHYDLSNDFFSMFLDDSMMYSSAMFVEDEEALDKAAEDKLDIICKKLNLSESDHLIEIGTGWGGMAIHAAQRYGCQVTTTTISQRQYDYSYHKIKRLGLEEKITVLNKDYRDLEGEFDKLVSIEMIEAVGHQFYPCYFEQCSKLLKDNGLALLQAITISDQRYHRAKTEVDFIQRYIFPGGTLPCISVIADCVANYTDMQIADLHDITSDYARTLSIWRQRFQLSIEEIQALGFDDIFCRMWEYYFCYCEGGFRERAIQTSQILMSKPRAISIDRH